MKETDIMRAIQVKASERGWKLFRNNIGVCRDPKMRFGLCKGSSDLVGWRSVTITPEMVGSKVAVFVAREVKTAKGIMSKEQAAFLKQLIRDGGDGAIARGVDDL